MRRATLSIRHASEGWHLLKLRTDLAAPDPSLRWGDGLREPS